ncbi:A24 family peptidase [Halobacillus sp. Marseille-Q1614]|uniref:prepilin peptidase n=1 Tax=Halobacillus sp. Marseille-Q1614 TaxID=2709134 RepID=UPI00156F363C|nr:A24 family peptidase [Halobacillus sp. Marseille-Q1614]
MFMFYFFLIGITLGSFYNVVGLRVPKRTLFTQHRSHCPTCHSTLSWYELIPIGSFIHQKGLCRHCSAKISILYPVMELLSGLIFTFSYSIIGLHKDLLLVLLLYALFHIIVVSDLKYMVIPNKVLLFFFTVFFLFRLIYPLDPWWLSLVGGLLGSGGIAVIIIISRGGMGGGDMKLLGLVGFILGPHLLLITFLTAVLLGTFLSVFLMAFTSANRKSGFPFGPFIAIGGMAAFFYGELIARWYLLYFLS